MKDKNGVTIKTGHIVKRGGKVRYADGMKYKLSKKSWVVSRVENDTLFYTKSFTSWDGTPVTEEVKLSLPKHDGDFLVVGDEKGLFEEHRPIKKVVAVDPGSVGENYRVKQDVDAQNWKEGDIVKIHGKVSEKTLNKGILEKVPNTLEHKHVLVVVDPVKLQGKQN